MTQERYVVLSLELHMFFGRIMMEHMLFLEARLMPASSELSKTAQWYRKQFEDILYNAVVLGDGVISKEAVASGEMVTAHTLASEQHTEYFTNIGTNQDITMMQEKLSGAENPEITSKLILQVRQLNAATNPLIDGIIELSHEVFVELQACRVFIAEYPLFVRNMLNESIDYKNRFAALERGNENHDAQNILLFWQQGILEHVYSYRNMFDPTETEMAATVDGFMRRYTDLMRETRMMNDALSQHILDAALKEVMDYRDFNEIVVKKIVDCEIQSAMFPQMTDHSLRELNYFVRLLKQQSDIANYLSQQ